GVMLFVTMAAETCQQVYGVQGQAAWKLLLDAIKNGQVTDTTALQQHGAKLLGEVDFAGETTWIVGDPITGMKTQLTGTQVVEMANWIQTSDAQSALRHDQADKIRTALGSIVTASNVQTLTTASAVPSPCPGIVFLVQSVVRQDLMMLSQQFAP